MDSGFTEFHRNSSWIPSKSVRSGFHIMDSGFHIMDSGFQSLTFAGSQILDSFTSGEIEGNSTLRVLSIDRIPE